MCINNSLVCNGVQNCVYPWDENHCKGNHLLSEVTGRLLRSIRIFKNVFQGWCSIFLFVHFFHFLFIYFSYSLLISPHPLPPSREAVQGTFSSDHKDPWHCHWCLIRHSSCSSYYLHPGPDEAAKEKGNSSFVVELLFSRKLDLARGEKTHSWKWWWDSRCSSEDREERQNQHMDFTPLHYTSEIIYHKIV